MSTKLSLHFIIVGHVDHGKSTLIGRLLYDTGSVPPDKIEEIEKSAEELGRKMEFAHLLDHLAEERQQGVTIDTTQVFFGTKKRDYVIIDAPGHVEFVKNMITGASQAEAAIVIVDVTEGVMEQTKRHAYILSMLGIKQVIVVINKLDLVNYQKQNYDTVRDEIKRFLQSIHINPLFFIPICATQGDNVAILSDKMDWYEGPCLLDSLDVLSKEEPPEDKPLLFPVQDVYKVGNFRITVGRIEAGKIKAGELIKILPKGVASEVKSIEKYMEQLRSAKAGQCIGITTREPVFIERGNVICRDGAEPGLSNTIKANIFWMAKRTLTTDQKPTLRCATQEVPCKLKSIMKRIDSSTLEVIEENAGQLQNLEVGEVIIETKRPIAIRAFNDVPELGRFVLVTDDNICAGGIITSWE